MIQNDLETIKNQIGSPEYERLLNEIKHSS